MAADPLDNPIWAALTSDQAALAIVAGMARRYPAEMARFAALEAPTPAAFADLRTLVAPGEPIGCFTADRLEIPDGWTVLRGRAIEQMVCPSPPDAAAGEDELLTLGQPDAPEMLALAAATQPGPFFAATVRMGRYLGIRTPDGRLVAMAGERLRSGTFTEISAVCTDPAFQGRGYGRTLVTALAARIHADGRLPCLHVKHENGAKRLYERLGFHVRRDVQLAIIAAP